MIDSSVFLFEMISSMQFSTGGAIVCVGAHTCIWECAHGCLQSDICALIRQSPHLTKHMAQNFQQGKLCYKVWSCFKALTPCLHPTGGKPLGNYINGLNSQKENIVYYGKNWVILSLWLPAVTLFTLACWCLSGDHLRQYIKTWKEQYILQLG